MLEAKSSQEHVDTLYQQFCDIYYNEMNCFLKSLNVSSKTKKTIKFKSKPFWNDALDNLWHEIVVSERQYSKSPQNSHLRKIKFSLYKNSCNKFNKEYKQEKRKFNRHKQNLIERVNSENPRQFWKHIKSLGPKRKSNQIPFKVYCYDKN